MLTTVFQNSFLFMYKIIYLTILFKKTLIELCSNKNNKQLYSQ